jgi:hypothetical protein
MAPVSPVAPVSNRLISDTIARAVDAASTGKDRVTVTEARAIITAAIQEDATITAQEEQQLARELAGLQDRFTSAAALEFASLAQRFGLQPDSAAIPVMSASKGARAVVDAFMSRVGTYDNGTLRPVGVAAVRMAVAEAYKDGRLSADERVGLSVVASLAGKAGVTRQAELELSGVRAQHNLPLVREDAINWK